MKNWFSLFLFSSGVVVAQLPPPPATTAEVTAGTDRYKYVTPYTLSQAGFSASGGGGIVSNYIGTADEFNTDTWYTNTTEYWVEPRAQIEFQTSTGTIVEMQVRTNLADLTEDYIRRLALSDSGNTVGVTMSADFLVPAGAAWRWAVTLGTASVDDTAPPGTELIYWGSGGTSVGSLADGSITTNKIDSTFHTLLMTGSEGIDTGAVSNLVEGGTLTFAGNGSGLTNLTLTQLNFTNSNFAGSNYFATVYADNVVGNGGGLTNVTPTWDKRQPLIPQTPWGYSANVSTTSVPIVAWQQDVQSSNSLYNAFPSVAYWPHSKRLIAAWTAGTNHLQSYTGKVKSSYSTDGGKTWSEPITMFDWTGGAGDWSHVTASISAVSDRLLMLLRNSVPDTSQHTNILLQSLDGVNWTTNSVFTRADDDISKICMNAGVVETPAGTWLAPSFRDIGQIDNYTAIHRSTDKGATWSYSVIDVVGNEASLALHPDGSVYANVRRRDGDTSPGPFVTYRSADDGATWAGPWTNNVFKATNNASLPHTIFVGNRMYVAGRIWEGSMTGLRYADDYPYYTNMNQMLLDFRGSAYCAGVALSDSAALWVGSSAVDIQNPFSSTNAVVTGYVVTEDGQGWTGNLSQRQMPQPYVRFSPRHKPTGPGSFTTNWQQSGTLAIPGATVSGTQPIVYRTNDMDLLVLGSGTGYTFGTAAQATQLHNDGTQTYVYLSQQTNTGNYAWVMDCNTPGTGGHGARLLHASAGHGVTYWVGGGTGGFWQGAYEIQTPLLGRTRPRVIMVIVSDNSLTLYVNGAYAGRVANTGLGSYSSASASTVPYLGTSSSSVQTHLLGGFAAFTNALTINEGLQVGAQMWREAAVGQ